WIEDSKAAAARNPMLAGVPAADVLLPNDRHGADVRRGQEIPGRSDRGCVAGMPAGKEACALQGCEPLQLFHFADRLARRLLQEDMLAGAQCSPRGLEAILGRHA